MNIISWSGGHDSTVMLHYLLHNRKDLEPFKTVFVDSTINIPDTLDYLKDIVKLFGIENQFVYLQPKRSFYQILSKYHFWPSIRALWCRKQLKMDVLKKFYNSFEEPLLEFIGISQKDSGVRKRLYKEPKKERKWGKKMVQCEYPLLHWSDEKKKNYMCMHNIPRNPVYKTFGLSGCYFCPFYHEPDFMRLLQTHPELFHKLLSHERAFHKRALPDFWLEDILKAAYPEEKDGK